MTLDLNHLFHQSPRRSFLEHDCEYLKTRGEPSQVTVLVSAVKALNWIDLEVPSQQSDPYLAGTPLSKLWNKPAQHLIHLSFDC